jgi:hypothetical protein
MTAATAPAGAIASALAAGITVRVNGERLVLSAPQRPDDRLLEELRREKPAIMAHLRELAVWKEEDWQALFDERAGIMEYDGGLSRAEAEERARQEADALRAIVTAASDV